MIVLEKRPQPSAFWTYATPVVAVVLTMIAGGLMFYALGKNPFEAIRTIFWDPLFNEQFASFSRPQLLVKAGPLILIAIGLAMGFRAGIWNIGAEGQYIIGAICGAAFGLAFYPSGSWLIFPGMVLAGALGGFLWAMIPALLKVLFRTNEILVSLLLVYVAEQLVAAMALGPLRNPEGGGFPGSRNLRQWEASSNTELIAGTGMHWGVAAAFIVVILGYIVMSRHLLGFHIRLAGEAPRAARFAGVSPARLVFVCFGIAGVLAGLAGLFEVTGPAAQISIDFASGYGFTAIIVAFLGRLHPVGILLAGFLMALTYIGGELAQLMLGIPAAAIQAFQGMLLFFLLGVDVLTNYRFPAEIPEGGVMGLASRGPVAALLGFGVLTGAVLVNLVPSIALVVLFATLLTATALAPLVLDAPEADWAGGAVGRLSEALARTWPGFTVASPRDRRTRLLAYLAGLNLAVFAAIFLRAGA